MVEAILHLLKIHREMVFGNSSVIVQNMFGKTPKSFSYVEIQIQLLPQEFKRLFHLIQLSAY